MSVTQEELQQFAEACRNSRSREEREAILTSFAECVAAPYRAKLAEVYGVVTYPALLGTRRRAARLSVHGAEVLRALGLPDAEQEPNAE